MSALDCCSSSISTLLRVSPITESALKNLVNTKLCSQATSLGLGVSITSNLTGNISRRPWNGMDGKTGYRYNLPFLVRFSIDLRLGVYPNENLLGFGKELNDSL